MTLHEIFKYLVKRFRHNEPIPHAKKFKPSANKVDGAGTAAVAETPEKSPTSTDTATEWHASAEWNNEDLTTTKALTRGTEDVDSGNTGCMEDPCMSFEASAKGTSTKCAEMTPVILESALPHEMQTEPHSSLPLTPSRCKQEVADSVVTAGRTNRMVRMAEPTKMVADVNRTALLGGEPAEMACEVDEGDGTERKDLQLLKAGLYCEERHQRNENTMDDIPIAYRLPLEGEWSVYSSDESDTLVIASIEPESTDSGEIPHVCLGGTRWCVCDVEGLGDPVDGVEPEGCEGGTDESTELLTMSVELYVEDSGDIPRVHLRGTRMRPGNMNGPGSQTDGPRGQSDVSKGQADRPRGWMDTLSVSDSAETAVISHRERVSTYLGVRDAKRPVQETDGVGIHVDASVGRTDTPSVETDVDTAENETRNVRRCQMEAQT